MKNDQAATVTEKYYEQVMRKQLGNTRQEDGRKDSSRPFFLKRMDKSKR